MTNHEHSQGQCPNCGRNEIEADRRYGNKLKGSEFLLQVFRSPIYWIGFALVVLPSFFLGPVATDQIAWRYGLSALGIVLTLIPIVLIRQAVFGPGAATRFPEARYTCRLCGHQWTSEEPRAAVVHETSETEATDRIESQEAKEDFHAVTEAKSQTSERSAAISFLLAIFLNLLVILLIESVVGADFLTYLGCLAVPMVILALGGGAGALLAKSFGGNPWKGVTIGIWIGAVASIAVLIVGVFAAGG